MIFREISKSLTRHSPFFFTQYAKEEEVMSMYLFDEQPILANKTLAREIGLNEALVLQQINYWIEIPWCLNCKLHTVSLIPGSIM